MSTDDERFLWESFRPKAKLIAGLIKHLSDRQQERANLIKFVEQIIEDFKDNGNDGDIENRYQFRVRKFSIMPKQKSRNTDKDMEYTLTKAGHDEFCFLCEEEFLPTEKIYPCRICTRAFHKHCLLSCKQCMQADKDCIERSQTNTGWSCYLCADLSLLLTDEETKQLIEVFDQIDVDHDSVISLEEFVNYKTKTMHLASAEHGREQLVLQFRKIDLDKDRSLHWWEFISHEAKLLLAKRSTDTLLDMLTEKEIVHAKAIFSRMDEDHDGMITHKHALMAYKDWYTKLYSPKEGHVTHTLDVRAGVAAKMVMDHDKTNTGTVSWADFISGQALYIICARPNI